MSALGLEVGDGAFGAGPADSLCTAAKEKEIRGGSDDDYLSTPVLREVKKMTEDVKLGDPNSTEEELVGKIGGPIERSVEKADRLVWLPGKMKDGGHVDFTIHVHNRRYAERPSRRDLVNVSSEAMRRARHYIVYPVENPYSKWSVGWKILRFDGNCNIFRLGYVTQQKSRPER